MVTFAERCSDILAITGMLSLLSAFMTYALGVLIHYGVNKRLIEEVGGHISSVGFLMSPLMLFECLVTRRIYNAMGKAVPRALQIEICCHLASIMLFVMFVIAGFGSGFVLERIP